MKRIAGGFLLGVMVTLVAIHLLRGDAPAAVRAHVQAGRDSIEAIDTAETVRAAEDSAAHVELERLRRRRIADQEAATASDSATARALRAALAAATHAAKDSAAREDLARTIVQLDQAWRVRLAIESAQLAAAERRAVILEARWVRADSAARRYQQVAVDLQRRLEEVANEVRPSRFWHGVGTGVAVAGIGLALIR